MEQEQELIKNRFELVDWIKGQVLTKVNAELKNDRQSAKSYLTKLQDKYETVFKSIASLNSYSNGLKALEDAINKRTRALQDRENNLQLIYNKMIEIEKRLNSGQWPGVLPPLNIDMEIEDEE